MHRHSLHSLTAKWVLPDSRAPDLEAQAAAGALCNRAPLPSPWCWRRAEGLHRGTLSLARVTERGVKHFGLRGPSHIPALSDVLVCLRGAEELRPAAAPAARALAGRAVKQLVQPGLVLMDRHWEGNQPSPGQNPATHEEFARVGSAICVVSCCVRTETAWLERNVGTFFLGSLKYS